MKPVWIATNPRTRKVGEVRQDARVTPFYKDGPRGDDFVLIRAKPFRLELVSQPHGIVSDPLTWRPTTLELP